MTRTPVWDPAVRLFHWSLVTGFAANALIIDPETKLHHWIGYAVVALVSFRILWGFVGGRYARFASFRPSLSASFGQLTDIATHRTHPHVGHSPLGALMIYNLIVTLLAIGVTGYLMTTDRFWGVEWPEQLHEAFVTWAEVSVVLHIVAVIFESKRTKVNLARAMVTGYKDLPES